MLRRPDKVVYFANIRKSTILLTKITLENSTEAKRITNYVLECNFYTYFPNWRKLLISREKNLTSVELKEVCNRIYSFFGFSLVREIGFFWLWDK